jgi:P27 family predicted phage terminase small subunit
MVGLAGPPPKPPERRQRRNQRTTTSRQTGSLVVLDGGAQPAPPLPPGLHAAARRRWEAFWASTVAKAVDRDSDLPALHRWIQAVDEYDQVGRNVRKGRLVKGSMGQIVAHPLLGYLAQLDAQIARAEQAFGMTPIARLRLGIALGDAARSLEELNRALDADDDLDEPEQDPRDRVVESTASPRRRAAAADLGAAGLPLDQETPRPRRG